MIESGNPYLKIQEEIKRMEAIGPKDFPEAKLGLSESLIWVCEQWAEWRWPKSWQDFGFAKREHREINGQLEKLTSLWSDYLADPQAWTTSLGRSAGEDSKNDVLVLKKKGEGEDAICLTLLETKIKGENALALNVCLGDNRAKMESGELTCAVNIWLSNPNSEVWATVRISINRYRGKAFDTVPEEMTSRKMRAIKVWMAGMIEEFQAPLLMRKK